MAPRILHAEIENRSKAPSEADVHLVVTLEEGDGAEVRARLLGPRCLHATTVEVGYPFRPTLVPAPRQTRTLRAVVPEASAWSPEAPHLYLAVCEVWQGGVRHGSTSLRLGLRDFRAGPRGLRCNGRPLTLRGPEVTELSEAEALRLRSEGRNLLVCPAIEASAGVWDVASRVGFAVIGRVTSETPRGLLRQLTREPSVLGWLFDEGMAEMEVPQGTLLGTSASHHLASAAHFVAALPGEPIPPGKPVLLLAEGPTVNPILGLVS
jgi:hypothetical protein